MGTGAQSKDVGGKGMADWTALGDAGGGGVLWLTISGRDKRHDDMHLMTG